MSKEIEVLRRRDGTLLIAQGDQQIVVPDPKKLGALIDRLKTCQFLMSSKRLAEIERELGLGPETRKEPKDKDYPQIQI